MAHVLKGLPELMGFTLAESVWRKDRVVANPPDESIIELDREDVPATDLHRLYVPGKFLYIQVEHAKIGDRVERAILKGVPEKVRGTFLPNRPYIRCGKHYLYDDEKDFYAEPNDPPIFARPTLTIGCWSYSTAENWKEMRRLAFKLPEIIEEQQRLEHLIGKLEHAMYWSI